MRFEEALTIKDQIAVGWWHTFCCNQDAEEIKTPEDLATVLADMDSELAFGCHPEHLWRSETEMKTDPVYIQWIEDDESFRKIDESEGQRYGRREEFVPDPTGQIIAKNYQDGPLCDGDCADAS